MTKHLLGSLIAENILMGILIPSWFVCLFLIAYSIWFVVGLVVLSGIYAYCGWWYGKNNPSGDGPMMGG